MKGGIMNEQDKDEILHDLKDLIWPDLKQRFLEWGAADLPGLSLADTALDFAAQYILPLYDNLREDHPTASHDQILHELAYQALHYISGFIIGYHYACSLLSDLQKDWLDHYNIPPPPPPPPSSKDDHS